MFPSWNLMPLPNADTIEVHLREASNSNMRFQNTFAGLTRSTAKSYVHPNLKRSFK
jgi:hypothetical protein